MKLRSLLTTLPRDKVLELAKEIISSAPPAAAAQLDISVNTVIVRTAKGKVFVAEKLAVGNNYRVMAANGLITTRIVQ